MVFQRLDGRLPSEMRPISFQQDFTRFAVSSVLAHCGDTKVLCTVSIRPEVPGFLVGTKQGWLTAEYRMLPSATPERHEREFLKLSGRTQEIQRLIGRSLRGALNLEALGERTLIVDADVLQADAGTRTTAITGGYVALAWAIDRLLKNQELEVSPLRCPVAAVSVGLLNGMPLLDLNYQEDVKAEVDFNVVMTGNLDIIEIQGTAESESFTRSQFNEILDVAEEGIKQLLKAQEMALNPPE